MLQGLHNSISDINIVTKYNCTMFITNDLSCFTQDIDHLMTEDAMLRSTEFLTGNLFRKESSIGTSIQSSKRTTGGSEFNSRDRRIHLVAICVMRGAGHWHRTAMDWRGEVKSYVRCRQYFTFKGITKHSLRDIALLTPIRNHDQSSEPSLWLYNERCKS